MINKKIYCSLFVLLAWNGGAQGADTPAPEPKESFVLESSPAAQSRKASENEQLVTECIELFEQFSHLCNQITRALATTQDAQLAKIHRILEKGESMPTKALSRCAEQLRKQIAHLKTYESHF